MPGPKGYTINRTFRDEHGQQQPPPLGLRTPVSYRRQLDQRQSCLPYRHRADHGHYRGWGAQGAVQTCACSDARAV
jgi:hypothetical protein